MSTPGFVGYVLFHDRRCQVLYYAGNGRFMILDRGDTKRLVHRDRLVFLP